MVNQILRKATAAGGILAVAVLSGCATTATLGPVANLPPYEGPKARIAVARFDFKAAKGRERVGEGLSDMLVTELVNSNRFVVLERENLGEVLTEQDLGRDGRVKAATAAPVGEVTGAETLVFGAVTEFEPDKMNLGGMLLGGATIIGTALINAKNSWVPVTGVTYTESHLAMDLRLVDAATGRVVSSVSVEGSAYDVGGGMMFDVGGGLTRMPVALGGFQKTSMEQAMRVAIARAVEAIVDALPRDYYRYGGQVPRDGELLGYAYLDIPSGTDPSPGGREAFLGGSREELAAKLGSRGIALPPSVEAVDFSKEAVIAAVGGPQDRGAGLGIQKIVNDPASVRIEMGIIPLPPGTRTEKPPTVPVILARVARPDKPLRAEWLEAPQR